MSNLDPNGIRDPGKTGWQRTCVVIDDEELSRSFLVNTLQKYFPEITILGEEEPIEGAVGLINHTRPDIVFLDVELIGGRGSMVLDMIEPGTFTTVFMTAEDAYRKLSRRYPNSRMLLKPISLAALREAVSTDW